MKKRILYFGNLLIISICLLIASCHSKKTNTAINIPKQEQVFKEWLRDTLATIKVNPDKITDGLVKSQFVVADDSLLVSELKDYEFHSKRRSSNKEISNVISLLKEYDEIPKGNFELSFTTKKSYEPSVIADFKYDFVAEMEDIVIQTTQTRTEYNYIRGRLSDKKVQSLLKSADQNDGLYDFIWEHSKLTKRKVK
ncbi:hypothetical protein [Pedobacter sp.]|jgi:hypothetical protein|uniref:hypothetical protein n=1 Tax=Pedobacter sp. TaxID=1411316 RepID=UPI002C347BF4|nr:hypothetical protein [Pedobacter sp.]HWW40025.1 hypothetical protein [Pedobacter sp.]